MHVNFGLVLALGALTNGLPTTNDGAPHDDVATGGAPFAEMQSKYNITDAQLTALNVSSVQELVAAADDGVALTRRRPEISSGEVCHWYYRIVMNRWIVQVPESWYVPKFTDAKDACTAWQSEMDRSIPGAAVIVQECERKEFGPLEGWMHMRFTTIIGIPGSSVEAVIGRMADPAGMVKDPKRIICL